jgi:Domain of unknown function (DUF4398)
MTRATRHKLAVAMALSVAIVAGCAVDRNPELQFAAAETAIADARRSDAQALAPSELLRAQEKMELSRRMVAARDFRPALWLVEQAHVDAELATMKAMSARALERATLAARELRAANILVAQRAN